MSSCVSRVRRGWAIIQLALMATPFVSSFTPFLGAVPHAQAVEIGWAGQYWNLPLGNCSGPSFPDTAPDFTRTDATIDFNWGLGSPDASIQNDCFVARWTRTVTFDAGNYIFQTLSDDGSRVYVDGKLAVDSWFDQGAWQKNLSKAVYVAGGAHEVKVEYYENSGAASIEFSYQKDQARDHWVTDGLVYAMSAGNDGTEYVGGSFNYAGPFTGYNVSVDLTNGQTTAPVAHVDGGNVLTSVSDGEGGRYIGGNFSTVGGVNQYGLAHILADGTLDTTWDPQPNSQVYQLAVSGTTLYAVGDFSCFFLGTNSCDSGLRGHIAAFDMTTGLLTSWQPFANNGVYSMAISGTTMYVGGWFSTVNGTTRHEVAALCLQNNCDGADTEAGQLTAWNPSASGLVKTMTLSGDILYVGGQFSSVGGQSRANIAALCLQNNCDGADTPAGVATAWNPGATNEVDTILVVGSTVYVGGYFSVLGNALRPYLGAVSASTGLATDWAPQTNDIVLALVASNDGSTIYAGGSFTSAGGQPRRSFAALDASTNTNQATALNVPFNGVVYSLNRSGSSLSVGGDFTSGGGVLRSNLAAFDPVTGAATSWNPGTNGTVYTVAPSGSVVYVGGEFTQIGESDRAHIAAISTSLGTATTWAPEADSTVRSIVVSGSTVYAGGDFTNIGGADRYRVASLAAGTDTNQATSWTPALDQPVQTMAISGGRLYVGGDFMRVGSEPRYRLASFDVNTGVLTDWIADANSSVYTIVPANGVLYVGGTFSSIGRGAARSNVAALDLITGAATSWNPYVDSTVFAIAANANTVFLGGYFESAGGYNRDYFAAVNAQTGTATSFQPETNGPPHAFLFTSTDLLVGGDFSYFEGIRHSYLVSLDLTTVGFATVSGTGMETTTAVSIPVVLSGEQAQNVTVDYKVTADGTAVEGVDFVLSDGALTIPAGETEGSIELIVTNNDVFSGTKTVVLSLSNPSLGTWLGGNETYTYTITRSKVAFESADTPVTPTNPGTSIDATKAISADGQYVTTALSDIDGGYDSQVYRFKPDLSDVENPNLRVLWRGHGDTPVNRPVHLSIWNFDTETWNEIDAGPCGTDCTLSGVPTKAHHVNGDGESYLWLKAENANLPPVISDVSDNGGLLPITWNTDILANSQVAFDTVSHANGSWDDYANHLADGNLRTTGHSVSPAFTDNAGRNWQALASSADGVTLLAGASSSNLFTSTDSGATWVDHPSSGSRNWISVAMTPDASVMFAADNFSGQGHIYRSTDGGVSWTVVSSAIGGRNWYGVSTSNNGQVVAAVAWPSDVYVSRDGGDTWEDQITVGTYFWSSVKVSADGSKIVAMPYMFTSSYSPASPWTGSYNTDESRWDWTEQTAEGNAKNWQREGLASSADLQTLYAVANGYDSELGWGNHLYHSVNGGETWNVIPLTFSCPNQIALSADLSIIAVTDSCLGGIYVSENSGDTWTLKNSLTQSWSLVTLSADGTKMVAAWGTGDIATSTNLGDTWTDRTGTVWYYRVRSASVDGDITDSTEYSVIAYVSASSCPFIFTWDGTKHDFIIDASNAGSLSSGLDREQWAKTPFYKAASNSPFPTSYTKISGSQLVPKTDETGTYYDVRATTELNEINYFDKTSMQTVDHSPSVNIYPDYRNNAQIHTIRKDAAAPVSVVDQDGVNVTDLVAANDNRDFVSSLEATTSYLDIKLTDGATTPANMKLVIKRGKQGVSTGSFKTGSDRLQVKNAQGQFVDVPTSYNIFKSMWNGKVVSNWANTNGIDTRVIDLSGLSIPDNTIRLVTTNKQLQWAIDWMAVDTTPDEAFTATTIQPYTADLHLRGVSRMENVAPGIRVEQPVYTDLVKTEGRGNPITGRATKYGEVAPLLATADDKFVIMMQGDELTMKYPVPAQADGTERDFVYFAQDYHKAFRYATGATIDPLPFNTMTQYPYDTAKEQYPSANQAYLDEYNTRVIDWAAEPIDTPHHSLNTDFITMSAPTDVYADTSYSSEGAGGHTYGVDAFSDIQDAVNTVVGGGTVHVNASLFSAYDVTMPIVVATPNVTIVGPGIDQEEPDQARIVTECQSSAFRLQAPGVTLRGLVIKDMTEGDNCRSNTLVSIESTGAVIDANQVAGGSVGIAFNGLATSATITNNVIDDNETGISLACSIPGPCPLGNTTVADNTLTANATGIFYVAGDQSGTVLIGDGNEISGDGVAIQISGNSYGLRVRGNNIHTGGAGLFVQDDLTGVDATRNYWGNQSGPAELLANMNGTGTVFSYSNAFFVRYRPFCLTADCNTFSSIETTPEALTNLFTVGTFEVPTNATPSSTTRVTAAEDLTLRVPQGGGVSTVFVPSGTTITQRDGETIDATTISGADVSLSAIQGMTSDTSVKGALQWGIPNVHLNFDPAITLHIYVGTDKTGSQLKIQRSVSGTADWTSDGIVLPATCTVDADGLCTFQATQASTYATFTGTGGTGSGGGNSGGGGGGGAFYLFYSNPRAMSSNEDLSFTVNDGNPNLTTNTVPFAMNAEASTVRGYSVSLDPKFADASILPYTPHATFTLPDVSGTYTVYLRYYGLNGNPTKTLQATVSYVSKHAVPVLPFAPSLPSVSALLSILTPPSLKAALPGSVSPFARVLRLGDKGEDVRQLQKFLNAHGVPVAAKGAGSPGHETTTYGPLLKKAILKYQELHAKEILAPNKLKKGTGTFGSSTLKFINDLLSGKTK